jgi:hypothetical protein
MYYYLLPLTDAESTFPGKIPVFVKFFHDKSRVLNELEKTSVCI